ncbi:alpha/beta hydrolase [Streptomyces sp. NPDC102462]|uniref:alpha/beta hydrolase n=1 Tax=Streptomyces sp. NPDC102462 TaxID=3366178 RepID=UPI00382440AD
MKEQTAGIYAERLAREGFAALVFDAAHEDESEGEPRGLENPFQRAEDIKSAVSFLTTRDEIDPDRIGALGICASGGYVPYAAQTDLRIKAVATVSAGDLGTVMRDGLGRPQGPRTLRSMLERAAAARTAEARDEAAHCQEQITEAVDVETYGGRAQGTLRHRGRHPRLPLRQGRARHPGRSQTHHLLAQRRAGHTCHLPCVECTWNSRGCTSVAIFAACSMWTRASGLASIAR